MMGAKTDSERTKPVTACSVFRVNIKTIVIAKTDRSPAKFAIMEIKKSFDDFDFINGVVRYLKYKKMEKLYQRVSMKAVNEIMAKYIVSIYILSLIHICRCRRAI
eukprot:TRINITY_DN5260_c0_g4_i1.p2 TRINITY_DN5260_c0_g4~~TRINITY_DN5260_c0_g4_i1.p2  ORF type:complete len:105 (-),score=22.05 TRINITY_DN5260_c0_g4_i1:52-366(-)